MSDQVASETGTSVPSIVTGGDLNVTADSVGTPDNALSTDVGGQLNVNGAADGTPASNVNVENDGDLTTGPIESTGDVNVNNDGDGPDITTGEDGKATVRSTNGDVGTKDDPISFDAGSVDAYGQNANVAGDPDLNIDNLVAEDTATATADGDITDTNNGAGVVADNVDLNAGGNIGSTDNPLEVGAGTVKATSGEDTNLHLTNPETDVDVNAGGDANIDSDGTVTGKVAAANATINAEGSAGTDEKPPDTSGVNGTTKVTSKYGGSNVKSGTPTPKPQPKPKPTPTKEDLELAKAKREGNNIIVAKAIAKGTKKAKIKWNKVYGATRYVVYYTKKGGKKLKKYKTLSGSKRSITVKKLKAGKVYTFKVVAYRMANGKWVKIDTSNKGYFVSKKHKKYTNSTKVKVKKSKVTLKVGKKAKIKAKVKKKGSKKLLKRGRKLRYRTSDKTVATVNKKGKITAKKKGVCTIYVQAVGGTWKKVKVTVK